MKTRLTCLTVITLGLVIGGAMALAKDHEQDKPKEKWTQLFNGKNLDGWTVKIKGCEAGDNHNDTFRVENGVMKVSYDKYTAKEGQTNKFQNQFGHIFYNTPYSHYRMRLEYRFTGEQCPGGPGWAFRNSGIMIHGQTVESMGKDQNFPVSIEVQLLGGNGKDERSTANLCTPGTNVVLDGKLHTGHCTNSKSKTYHGDQWVTVEIEVRGNQVIRHIIDGEVVLEYTQPQLDERDGGTKKMIEQRKGDKMLDSGTISLQAESHPCEFRKVELLVLDQ